MPAKDTATNTSTSSQNPVDTTDQVGQNQSHSQSSTPAATESNQSTSAAEEHVLHTFDVEQRKPSMKIASHKLTIGLAVIAIVAGIATGYGGYRLQVQSGSGLGVGQTKQPLQQVAGESVKAGDVFGVQDEQTFKDNAEGYLETGGIDGEGSHKLLRPGGDSQTVYLTSSITDLDKFVGMEVKIWGETFKGQKAGWLMDVGRVEIVDPEAEPPVEE